MQIGLIGGIGPAATDFYMRALIDAMAQRGQPLDMTITYTDSPTLLGNLAKDDKASQVAIYNRLTDRLAEARAGCVAVTSIGGHFCIEEFKRASSLPVIDMIKEVAKWMQSKGLSRVGILGTATVMETSFYGGLPSVDVLVPQGEALAAVHDAYVTMAKNAKVTPDQMDVFNEACADFKARGAEAVMLGGTDLVLAYGPQTAPMPLVDCATIHVEAIADFASSS